MEPLPRLMLNTFVLKLNIHERSILMCTTVCINSFIRVPSTPVDLISFIAIIFLATISGFSINSPI